MIGTMEEELISRREAAKLAGVHYNTIRLWEAGERLTPHRQPNGDVLISRAELEEVIQARKEEDGSDDDSPRVAALEAENRLLREERDQLREQLAAAEARYERLVEKVTRLAAG